MTPSNLGVVTAVREEYHRITERMQNAHRDELAGAPVHRGLLSGVPTVVAECGYGKVNAAIAATALLTNGCDRLIMPGVAGGVDPGLEVGDVVVGRRVVMYDYGLEAVDGFTTYQPGALPLPGQPTDHGYELPTALAERARAAIEASELPMLSSAITGGAPRTPRVVFGTIVTGDRFVASPSFRDHLGRLHGAHAVEMEGAAVAQVADRFGAPALVVRCLSDLAGEEGSTSFLDFLDETSSIAARIVAALAPIV